MFIVPLFIAILFSLVFIVKSGSKMVKISNAFYENEIHRVDSPFNEDSKNIIFLSRKALISGEGRLENLREMAKTRETCCYAN